MSSLIAINPVRLSSIWWLQHEHARTQTFNLIELWLALRDAVHTSPNSLLWLFTWHHCLRLTVIIPSSTSSMSLAHSSSPQTESSRPKQDIRYANSIHFRFLNNRLWTYRVGFLWKVRLVFAAERQLQPTETLQFRDSNRISKEIISFQIKNITRFRWCEGP